MYVCTDRMLLRTPANETTSQIIHVSTQPRYTSHTCCSLRYTGCSLGVRSPVPCQHFPCDSFIRKKPSKYRRYIDGASPMTNNSRCSTPMRCWCLILVFGEFQIERLRCMNCTGQ